MLYLPVKSTVPMFPLRFEQVGSDMGKTRVNTKSETITPEEIMMIQETE